MKSCLSSFLACLSLIAISAAWPSAVLACTVTLDRPDVVFPLEKMNSGAVCSVLDHPALTSNAVRYYRFGGYVVKEVSATVFTGEDREGGEATVTLLYQDTTRRVYHLRGSQRGYIIPLIAGSGIVMLNYHPTIGTDGREGVETRVTVFSRLDNRFLANLVKLLRPILQRLINNKLTKGVKTVNRLTEFLAQEPEEVRREADQFAIDAGQAQTFRALLLPSVKKGG